MKNSLTFLILLCFVFLPQASARNQPRTVVESPCAQWARIRETRDEAILNLERYCPPEDESEREKCISKMNTMLKLIIEIENPTLVRDSMGNRRHESLINDTSSFIGANGGSSTPSLRAAFKRMSQNLKDALNKDIEDLSKDKCYGGSTKSSGNGSAK